MKLVNPDYENSNIGIPCSLLKHYGFDIGYKSIGEVDKLLSKNYKNIVYVILDGMGINIMEKHLDKNGFFHKHLLKKVTTVYPSTTVSATTALHSGLSPFETSWLGWHMRFKKYDESIELFAECKYYSKEKVDIRNCISYTSIYDKISLKNVEICKIFPKKAGGEYETFDEMICALDNCSKGDEKKVISFYYNEPDSLLHRNGVNSSIVKEKLLYIEKEFEKLTKKIEDSLIIITADHGHIDTTLINLYEYKDIVNCLKFDPAGEFRCVQFYVKDEFKSVFKKLFNDKFSQDFKLYEKEEFLTSGLLGTGIKHKNLDEVTGDYVAVGINDKSIVYIKENGKQKNIITDHAGLTEEEMVVPIIAIECK